MVFGWIMSKRVLSIGQCAADTYGLTTFLRGHFGAELLPVGTAKQALAALRQEKYDLVLINRLLDADGSQGMDILRRMKADPELARLPVMLVSNYAASQLEAKAAGALPGFGKSQLDEPQTLERLEAILGKA